MRICWFARLCEPDCVPSGPPTYDGLIVGWTGYTNIPTRVRRVAFLKARARELCRNRPLKFVSCAAQWLPRRGSCLPDGQLFRFFSPRTKGTIGRLGDRLSDAHYAHSFTSDERQNRAACRRVSSRSLQHRMPTPATPLALQSDFLVDIICETPRPSTV
jgi:hypothetical protein